MSPESVMEKMLACLCPKNRNEVQGLGGLGGLGGLLFPTCGRSVPDAAWGSGARAWGRGRQRPRGAGSSCGHRGSWAASRLGRPGLQWVRFGRRGRDNRGCPRTLTAALEGAGVTQTPWSARPELCAWRSSRSLLRMNCLAWWGLACPVRGQDHLPATTSAVAQGPTLATWHACSQRRSALSSSPQSPETQTLQGPVGSSEQGFHMPRACADAASGPTRTVPAPCEPGCPRRRSRAPRRRWGFKGHDVGAPPSL